MGPELPEPGALSGLRPAHRALSPNDGHPTGIRRRKETAMPHPGIAYDIVSGQRKAMIAQAATAARVRAAQRAIGGSRGRWAPALLSWVRVSFRPRTA
jgi:hypothetical protein